MEEKIKLVKIKETDWHFKLVKFCWKINPKVFRNLCPYFWLVMGSLVAAIPMSLYRGAEWCIKHIIGSVGKYWEKYNEECSHKVYKKYVQSLSKGQIYYLKYRNNDSAGIPLGTRKHKKFTQFYLGSDKDLDDLLSDAIKEFGLKDKDIKKYKNDFKLELEKEEELYEKKCRLNMQAEIERENREEKMRELGYKISEYSKHFFTFSIVLLCGLLGFILLTALTDFWCYLSSLTIDLSSLISGLIIVAVTMMICLLPVNCVVLYIKYREEDKNNPKYTIGVKKVLYYIPLSIGYILYHLWHSVIGKFIYYIIYLPIYVFLLKTVIGGILRAFRLGIVEFGGIFGNYFNASYSDYCPGIDWEDKNK